VKLFNFMRHFVIPQGNLRTRTEWEATCKNLMAEYNCDENDSRLPLFQTKMLSPSTVKTYVSAVTDLYNVLLHLPSDANDVGSESPPISRRQDVSFRTSRTQAPHPEL
jgi:hypothetical protein